MSVSGSSLYTKTEESLGIRPSSIHSTLLDG
jgi:hypothetical protein